jgi:hypothetical protein
MKGVEQQIQSTGEEKKKKKRLPTSHTSEGESQA